MAKKDAVVDAEGVKEPSEILFDDALAAVGLDPREAGEDFETYAARVAQGPNTLQQLTSLAEHVRRLDRGRAMHAAQSAREFHKDPNPADTHPRSR